MGGCVYRYKRAASQRGIYITLIWNSIPACRLSVNLDFYVFLFFVIPSPNQPPFRHTASLSYATFEERERENGVYHSPFISVSQRYIYLSLFCAQEKMEKLHPMPKNYLKRERLLSAPTIPMENWYFFVYFFFRGERGLLYLHIQRRIVLYIYKWKFWRRVRCWISNFFFI